MGELMEGAMQQAPQPGRQFMGSDWLSKQELIVPVLIGLKPYLITKPPGPGVWGLNPV